MLPPVLWMVTVPLRPPSPEILMLLPHVRLRLPVITLPPPKSWKNDSPAMMSNLLMKLNRAIWEGSLPPSVVKSLRFEVPVLDSKADVEAEGKMVVVLEDVVEAVPSVDKFRVAIFLSPFFLISSS